MESAASWAAVLALSPPVGGDAGDSGVAVL